MYVNLIPILVCVWHRDYLFILHTVVSYNLLFDSSENMGSGPSFPVVSLSKERIVIVTGANSGIGYEIAKQTAMMGATVILAGRSEDRNQKAMVRMQDEFKAEKAKGNAALRDISELHLIFMKLDLASFKSTLQFCEDFKNSGRQLHVLFCNAGLGMMPYTKTEDGLEQVMQANYLSHFIIMAKLLPIMKRSGPDCRIVSTSSLAEGSATFDIETMNYTGPPNKFATYNYYGRSKLYQIMQTAYMARKLKGSNITINCIDPGVVRSSFVDNNSELQFRLAVFCVKTLHISNSPLKGASSGIDLTVNPKHAGVSGHYWRDCRIKTPSNPAAMDEQKQELLWKETIKFIGQYLTDDDISGMEGK